MRLAAHLVLVVATGAFAYSAGWQTGHLARAAESESVMLDRSNLELLRDAAEYARAGGDEELAGWHEEAARHAAARQRHGDGGRNTSLAAGGR